MPTRLLALLASAWLLGCGSSGPEGAAGPVPGAVVLDPAVLAASSLGAGARPDSVGVIGQGFAYPDLDDLPWERLKPGDSVLIAPGSYPANASGNSLQVRLGQGTAEQPIVIGALDRNSPPILEGGLDLAGMRHVIVRDLIVRRPPGQNFAAVVVRDDSADIELRGLDVSGATIGISVHGAGVGVRITASHVHDNVHMGILLAGPVAQATGIELAGAESAVTHPDGITASTPPRTAPAVVPRPGSAGVVSGNRIIANGGHGIDILASGWTVRGNRLTRNGHGYGGTSGIHLFSAADQPGDCDANILSGNLVEEQRDDVYVDGNGILIDHYCDDNLVAFNVLRDNDGAGIGIVAGRDNRILRNTLFQNARDAQRAAFPGAQRAEINLHSLRRLCINTAPGGRCVGGEQDIPAGRSGGNRVLGNVIAPRDAPSVGLNASADFVDPARHQNLLGPNLYVSARGDAVRWADRIRTSDPALIDQGTAPGNLVRTSPFLDPTAPGPEGLRLREAPADRLILALPATDPALTDIAGIALQGLAGAPLPGVGSTPANPPAGAGQTEPSVSYWLLKGAGAWL